MKPSKGHGEAPTDLLLTRGSLPMKWVPKNIDRLDEALLEQLYFVFSSTVVGMDSWKQRAHNLH